MATRQQRRYVVRPPPPSCHNVVVVFVFLCFLLPNCDAFRWLSLLFQDDCDFFTSVRCGLWDLGFVMYDDGTPGTTVDSNCRQICHYLPILSSYKCGVCEGYDITLDLVGDAIQADAEYFVNATAVWEKVIQQGAPDLSRDAVDGPKSDLGIENCSFPSNSIDDVVICASYIDIDGPGNVYGYAQPTRRRRRGGGSLLSQLLSSLLFWKNNDNGLVYAGEMVFDTDDIDRLKQDGTFATAISHEIGHVLGVGVDWAEKGIATLFCSYRGKLANAEYQKLSGCDNDDERSVPLDIQQGLFTRSCLHWNEECLQTELMTPALTLKNDTTTVAPLSRITVGALEDLSYKVNYDGADPFTTNDLNPNCTCVDGDGSLEDRKLWQVQQQQQQQQQQQEQSADDHDATITTAIPSSSSGRMLSTATYQSAVRTGMSVLKRNRARRRRGEADTMVEEMSRSSSDDYIGDMVISVLVVENGNLYSVLVNNRDMEC